MDRTCEERIEDRLEDRLEDLGALTRALEAAWRAQAPARGDRSRLEGLLGLDSLPATGDELEEACRSALDSYGLELTVGIGRPVRWLLSTGGPADWFELELDSELDIVRARYVFEDWFDHAERALDKDARDVVASALVALVGDVDAWAREAIGLELEGVERGWW